MQRKTSRGELVIKKIERKNEKCGVEEGRGSFYRLQIIQAIGHLLLLFSSLLSFPQLSSHPLLSFPLPSSPLFSPPLLPFKLCGGDEQDTAV
jgi:hypothetical protein